MGQSQSASEHTQTTVNNNSNSNNGGSGRGGNKRYARSSSLDHREGRGHHHAERRPSAGGHYNANGDFVASSLQRARSHNSSSNPGSSLPARSSNNHSNNIIGNTATTIENMSSNHHHHNYSDNDNASDNNNINNNNNNNTPASSTRRALPPRSSSHTDGRSVGSTASEHSSAIHRQQQQQQQQQQHDHYETATDSTAGSTNGSRGWSSSPKTSLRRLRSASARMLLGKNSKKANRQHESASSGGGGGGGGSTTSGSGHSSFHARGGASAASIESTEEQRLPPSIHIIEDDDDPDDQIYDDDDDDDDDSNDDDEDDEGDGDAYADEDEEADYEEEDDEDAIINHYYRRQHELQRQQQEREEQQQQQNQQEQLQGDQIQQQQQQQRSSQQQSKSPYQYQRGGLMVTDMADRVYPRRHADDSSDSQQSGQNHHPRTDYAAMNDPQHSNFAASVHTTASTVLAGNNVNLTGGTMLPNQNPQSYYYYRRTNEVDSVISDMEEYDQEYNRDFFPIPSREYEWMGRSIESLILGHLARAPVLQLMDDDLMDGVDFSDAMGDYGYSRRRSTASTFGGSRRRSTASTFGGGRRSSLSLSGNPVGGGSMQGGTLANYYNTGGHMQRRYSRANEVDRSYSISSANNGMPGDIAAPQRQARRSSTAHAPMGRRRSSIASSVVPASASGDSNESRSRSGKGGPSVLLNIMARESTGKSVFSRGIPETQRLRTMGAGNLFNALDKPAAGMASEVAFLAAAIDTGDWAETHAIVSRLVVRLIGDPAAAMQNHDGRRSSIDDPNLPPTAPRFYAGGGRLGLERDAFVQAGGVQVMIRMFREKSFVGQEMAYTYDARDLSQEIVATRLAPCWNEALATLRELVYFMPLLVEDGIITDDGDFLPFLFTLLSHDSCFDAAAALIEEMLSFMSQTQQQPAPAEGEEVGVEGGAFQASGRASPASTFFLGNVPDLYKLWREFNCRQLAHFCRILALLVFEPEDRQLLESPAVLKSLELLQLRRNRAARAGRDSTVDMNQAILLGDDELIRRLLKLLAIMNFAPPLRRFTPYHVMAHFPFIADTLVMLGLNEIDNWDEADRQERLARKVLEEDFEERADDDDSELLLSDLGSVADMLEGLSDTLMNVSRQAPNQIGHIIHVISAAQQAGVIVGRNRNRRNRRSRRNQSSEENSFRQSGNNSDGTPAGPSQGESPVDGNTIQGLASVAGILTDQILVRRLYQNAGQDYGDNTDDGGIDVDPLRMGNNFNIHGRPESRHLINTPEDAANSLQFNAMLLGPYQVEVLFVLCTLLGGRRKLDAQDMLNRLGIVSVLEDMFQRLPWYKGPQRQSQQQGQEGSTEENAATEPVDDSQNQAQQPNGIHGPGCECTPESALCVQYLRMLHNFCDRDCDNYDSRRLLLSESERQLIFSGTRDPSKKVKPGLLSKIIQAFTRESDESPYRFWLASCIESYLRGSSPTEQMFAAQSGLLDHLVEEISSDRLHCAGSLQTSFDLLGELGKGNSEVINLLVNDLDEESFRKLMSVAAANLVDSNVFIRSLLLSLERLSAENGLIPLYLDAASCCITPSPWDSPCGSANRSYLTHSWWDTPTFSLLNDESRDKPTESDNHDEGRPSDWFPPRDLVVLNRPRSAQISTLPAGLNGSVGHFGWVFTPVGDTLTANAYLPNTADRLSWFLAANQARLLRDLLGVVDLRNINHENICCLNTAVVVAIFAHRRKQLSVLLQELRKMNDEEKESKRRALTASSNHDDVVDRAFVQAMRYLDLDHQRENPPYARRASLSNYAGGGGGGGSAGGSQQIGDRTDVMRNFREVLWFWMEYYTHRGRDRLSLEFSSHIRFQEWNHVVNLLAADDGSATSLVRAPVRLPRSPYQRAARVADSPMRGE